MLFRSKNLGAGALAADLAALISERDGLPRDSSVDVETRLLHVRGSARERMRQVAKQIRDGADIKSDSAAISHGVLLGFAYPDRIAQKRGSLGRFRMASGAGAIVPAHDLLAKEDYIAVALLDGTQVDAKVYLAAQLSRVEIDLHFKDLITETSGVFWDAKANAVSAARNVKLSALVLEERALATPEPEAVQAAMAQGVQAMGLTSLPWNDASKIFRTRIMFLSRVMPETGWPDFSDAHLLATVSEWLQPYLAGMSRKAHLSNLDMLTILRGLVEHSLLSKIERLAPSRMEVPGGGQYKIDYDVDGDPVLSVRLQEMFGLKSAPQIAEGRARLKIELLSPGGKPVAVTQSMETFWVNVYPEVRRDMRGRYPKHSWPEDPLTAIAVAPSRLR